MHSDPVPVNGHFLRQQAKKMRSLAGNMPAEIKADSGSFRAEEPENNQRDDFYRVVTGN